jgi:hypothetical protein
MNWQMQKHHQDLQGRKSCYKGIREKYAKKKEVQ